MIKNILTSYMLNLGLRGLSMLAKFLLIIYIGKYLSVSDLGEYGIFVITVSIAIYFLGWDFYTFNTRQILSKKINERFSLIRDQFVFHVLIYVFVLPALFLVFLFGVLPLEFIPYFYLILIFEHLSQELYRIFTTLQQPLFANILLFLRSGFWVYVIIAFWIMGFDLFIHLEVVWIGWLSGSFLSIIIGIWGLNKKLKFIGVFNKVDWVWIKNGFLVSTPFFIGTLAYKVIEFSDRYMIDYYLTSKQTGIYVFYSSLANLVNTIVFTMVIMVYYPIVVDRYQHQKEQFLHVSKIFAKKTFWAVLLAVITLIVLIYPVLGFIGKEDYSQNIEVLLLLTFGNVLLNISFIPHYILYAVEKDTVIRNATVFSAITNVVLNIYLIKYYGITGAAISTIISFLMLLFIKGYYAFNEISKLKLEFK